MHCQGEYSHSLRVWTEGGGGENESPVSFPFLALYGRLLLKKAVIEIAADFRMTTAAAALFLGIGLPKPPNRGLEKTAALCRMNASQHLCALIAGVATLKAAGALGFEWIALKGQATAEKVCLGNEKLGNTVCSDWFRGKIGRHTQIKSELRRVITFCPC